MLRKLPDAVAAADQLIAITGHPVQIPACIAIAAARASLRSWAKEIWLGLNTCIAYSFLTALP